MAAGAALIVSALPASADVPPEFATPGHHHGRVLFPTRGTHTPPAAGAASGSGSLTYGGAVDGIGVTTGSPKVYLVFYGSQWGSKSTDGNGNTTFTGDANGVAPRLQQLFKGVGTNNETWSGVMTQYCEGVAAGSTTCASTDAHVGYPTGGALAGVWEDNLVTSPSKANGHQLALEAIKAAGHFGNTTAASNRSAQYVVVSPHGTHPDGFNTFFGNFCAWHDYNGDTTLSGGAASSSYGDIAFTNLGYIPDMGASCGASYVNAGSAGALDGVTIVEGHEYAETVTDQNPAGGWIDNSGYENADKCAWNGVGGTGGAQNVAFATGSFAMQSTYSNDAVGCQISHPIVTTGTGGGTGGGGGGGGGGGTPSTITVTSPGNQTTTVGTAVSLQLSATDSASLTPTWTATGLPAGLSISTSGLISGAPTTASTSSVTATASDTTGGSGSTSFTWTVNPQPTTGCTPTQLLGNSGFETGSAAPWTASSGVINSSTAQPAHSGTWDAWLDGYGTTHTDRLSQSVTVPSACANVSLSFWLHVASAETTTTIAYDRLTVQAVVGTTITMLATYSNLNKASGYQPRSFSLSGLAGQTVTLRFTGTENGSLQTSFVIDDTALTVS